METLNTFPPSAHPKLPLLSIWVNGYPTRGQTSWSHPAPSPCVLSHIESMRNQSTPTPIPLPPNRHLPCSSHAGLILAVPQTCQDHSQLRAFALACPSLCLECPPHIHPQGSPPWDLNWHVLPHETSLTTWPEVTPIAHPCLSLLCSSLALISI